MFKKKVKLTLENPIVGAFKVSPNDSQYGKNGVLLMNYVGEDQYTFSIDEERLFEVVDYHWLRNQPSNSEDIQEAILTIRYLNQTEESITLLCNQHLGKVLLSKVPNKKPVVEKPQAMGMDTFEKIKQLKELLDMGAITQSEFDEKKKQLLDLI